VRAADELIRGPEGRDPFRGGRKQADDAHRM